MDAAIKKLEADVKRNRKKDIDSEDKEMEEELPSFPLVDVPDSEASSPISS